MNTVLAKLAVILCMAVQAWIGCARGPGMSICLQSPFAHDAAAELAADSCEQSHCCDHHSPIAPLDPPAPELPREHDQSCPSCIDLTPPGAAVLTTRVATADNLSQTFDVGFVFLPACINLTLAPPALKCPPWAMACHTPDARKARLACGLVTTRLLV